MDDRLSTLFLIRNVFSLGVFLWAELIKKHDTRNIFWIVLFCIAGCAQIIAETRHGNSDWNVAYPALTPCAVWLASIALIIASVRTNAFLHTLPTGVVKLIQIAGMMTYPLYLLHQILGGIIMGWMVAHGFDRWVALEVTLAVIFCFTWVVATQAEPWLQAWTKQLVTGAHDRYRSARLRFSS